MLRACLPACCIPGAPECAIERECLCVCDGSERERVKAASTSVRIRVSTCKFPGRGHARVAERLGHTADSYASANLIIHECASADRCLVLCRRERGGGWAIPYARRM
jgi:hypothetical protein